MKCGCFIQHCPNVIVFCSLHADAEKTAAERDALRYALQTFVDQYDQSGIGPCLEGHDDDPSDDGFSGDERFNVRLARAALADCSPAKRKMA